MVKTAHIYVSGSVQGVGYRQFVRHYARKLGITGWVQNLPDGRVECLIQGLKESLDQMILRCRKGSFVSEVKNVEVVWEESEEIFQEFEVRK